MYISKRPDLLKFNVFAIFSSQRAELKGMR